MQFGNLTKTTWKIQGFSVSQVLGLLILKSKKRKTQVFGFLLSKEFPFLSLNIYMTTFFSVETVLQLKNNNTSKI